MPDHHTSSNITCEVSLCYGCRTRTWNVSSNSTITVNLRRLLLQISNNCCEPKETRTLHLYHLVLFWPLSTKESHLCFTTIGSDNFFFQSLTCIIYCHTQSCLWPRTGLEPAFTRQHREYRRTCAYSVSNLWQFRESVIPHCWITYITHLPKSLGATLPFVHQAIWSGRQDSNLRPLVPKTSVLPTELLPEMCGFL